MNKKNIFSFLILIVLVGIGIWSAATGKVDFGIGLIVGAIVSRVLIIFKHKRVTAIQATGMNPYDERAERIIGKAAWISLRVFALLSAVVVLIGFLWGPKVNAFILLGCSLAGLLLIYTCFCFYYNHEI